jgi:hypothetical protein
MKKLLAIMIMLSYTCCALGLTFSIHHCKGKLRYVSLKEVEGKKKCCDSKKKMPKNCCKHNKIVFKKSDDRATTALQFAKFFPEVILPIAEIPYTAPTRLEASQDDRAAEYLRPPPLRTGQPPLYITYSVFLI